MNKWHLPPVRVEAETAPLPPLRSFSKCPAEEISVGDLLIRRTQVWRVKSVRRSKTSPRLLFELYPVAGGAPEVDVYYPRQWLFTYKSKVAK